MGAPLEIWEDRIPNLRTEISELRAIRQEIIAEETEARKEMRSLMYAAQLTRNEAQRRHRANSELRSAYELSRTFMEESDLEEVQRLEGELLNAKRDAANVLFEVEQLECRAKSLKECRVASQPLASFPGVRACSPSMRSPVLSTLPSGGAKSSPSARPSRLIGDVDCVLVFAGADGDASKEMYAPCRLGIMAGARVAIFSYAGSIPLVYLDEQNLGREVLREGDVEALREYMNSVGLQISGGVYELCGLREATAASLELIRDANSHLQVDNAHDT